ncbi:hypothetical protein Tco_1387806 [Tanacetum coccineum]
MSSDNASSTVTYTSVSSDSNGPSSWGIPLVNAGEIPELDPYEEVASKRISEKRTKNQAENDKTEQAMEKREKDKVKSKPKSKKPKSTPRSQRSKPKPKTRKC